MLKSWEYVDEYVATNVNLNSSPHTFSALQGDKYDYKFCLVMEASNSSGSLYFRFNGDSGANYREYYVRGAGSAIKQAIVSDTNTLILASQTRSIANHVTFCECFIRGESGQERLVSSNYLGYDDLAAADRKSDIRRQFATWKNTADEISSMTFSTTDSATVDLIEIYLFRRQKDSIFQASDWTLIQKEEFSGRDLNASPLVINNLQGDEDEEYFIEWKTPGTTTVQMRFNGDSGSNYRRQELYNSGGTLGAGSSLSTLMAAGGTDTTYYIKAKSGAYRPVSISRGRNTASLALYMERDWWLNTADELNSIEFSTSGSSSVTAEVKVYKKSKNRSSMSHERLIYDFDFSGDFSSGQEFKNLDTNKMYKISIDSVDGGTDAGFIGLRFNGDSGSNYFYQYLDGYSSTTSAQTGTWDRLYGSANNGAIPQVTEVLLFPKTGTYRPVLASRGYYLTSGTDYYITLLGVWWTNTVDDLKDILIFNSSSNSITGNIKIWEIDLP